MVLTLFAVAVLSQLGGPDRALDAIDPGQDPRNWPTVTRLVSDRYEVAGQVFTLRAHARKSDYYNCGYAGTERRLMAFTLLGGPLETLTGYMPSELGKVLERVLEADPYAQVTVQVSFDPSRLSELCIDQVDILKWSRGWQYPPETLSPARPDSAKLPSVERLQALAQSQIWRDLLNPDTAPVGQQVQVTGGVRLSNAMHCAFRGMWRSHWGLQLHDGRGRVLHAYLPRSEKNRELVDHLAVHREAMVAIQGRVAKVAMSTYCAPQLEVVGWTLVD
jgi:hypothetical protein